jgi:hypothetical protein
VSGATNKIAPGSGCHIPKNRGSQMGRRFFDVLDNGALRVGFSDCWRRNAKTGNIASAQRLVRGALPIIVTLLG